MGKRESKIEHPAEGNKESAEGNKELRKQELIQQLSEKLEGIHNAYFCSTTSFQIEDQCEQRFGMGWEETRKRVIQDTDAMSLWNTHIDDMAHEGTTGHWMINKLMKIWMLRKRWQELGKKDMPENFHGFGGRSDMQRELDLILEDNDTEIDERTLFYVAPILAPDKVKGVLASHGLIEKEPK